MSETLLSKSLEAKLKRVRSKYLSILIQQTLVKLLAGVAFSYLLLYGLDRFFETPVVVRLLISLATLIFIVRNIFVVSKTYLLFQKSYLPIIDILQTHFSELGDSLQSAIELACEKNRPSNISLSLCISAIEKVEKKVASYKFSEAIDYSKFLRFLGLCIFTFSCVWGLWILSRQAFLTTFSRWVNPLSDKSRYLFTQLALESKRKIVVRGESSFFKVEVKKDSYFQPDSFEYQLNQGWKDAYFTREKNQVLRSKLEIPPLTKPLDLRIRKSDFKQVVEIIPKYRPELLSLKMKIQYPKYLGIKEGEKNILGKKISVLPDSKISFIGKVNKRLERVIWTQNEKNLNSLLSIKEKSFETEYKNFEEKDKLSFSWIDEDKISSKKKNHYTIVFDEDKEPEISLVGIKGDHRLLGKDIIELKISGSDDFGLREIGYEWVAKNKEGKEVGRYTQVIRKGSVSSKSLEARAVFSPVIDNIPEESNVLVRAYAQDYRPHSSKTYTNAYNVYVLSVEEHLAIIEEKFRKILQRIKSLVQSEQNNIKRNERLEIYSDEKIVQKEVDQEILTLAEFENDNAQTIRGLVKKGGLVIKEAYQNELLKNSVISSWQKLFQAIEVINKKYIVQATSQFKQASKQHTAKQRREILSDAKDNQEEALRLLEDISGKYADVDRDSEVSTFAVRLRNNAKREKKISNDLKSIFIRTAGIPFDALAKKEKKFLGQIISLQKKVNTDISSMEHELFTLFNRSRLETYKKVYDQIISTEVNKKLKELYEAIAKNKTRSSIEPANKWSEKFSAWANFLEPKEEDNKDEQDEQAADEQDQKEQEDADNEFLVVIQRLADEEEKIYKLTRNLINWNRNQRYAKKLSIVKRRQDRNAKKVAQLTKAEQVKPKIKQVLASTSELMVSALGALNKKGASQEALNFEASSLELLLTLIKSQQQSQAGESGKGRSGKGNSSGKGQGDGQGQGDGEGSGGGGDGQSSDLADKDIKNNKSKFESRLKKTLRGTNSSELINSSPIEYHKALDSYYKKLEKQK